jgi:hypothetical protein
LAVVRGGSKEGRGGGQMKELESRIRQTGKYYERESRRDVVQCKWRD